MSICEECNDSIHKFDDYDTLENTMVVRRKTTDGYMLKETKQKKRTGQSV